MYEKSYGYGLPCGSPVKDEGGKAMKGLGSCRFKIEGLSSLLSKTLNSDDKLFNAFFVLCSMCAIAKDTGKKDIMVSWTYHGRDTEVAKNICGNFLRIYPIRCSFDGKKTVKELREDILGQCKKMLKQYYYPYLFEYEYDVDVMNNIYQKDFNTKKTLCGFPLEHLPVPDKDLSQGIFINQVIDGSYNVYEKNVEVEWTYPYSKFHISSMENQLLAMSLWRLPRMVILQVLLLS